VIVDEQARKLEMEEGEVADINKSCACCAAAGVLLCLVVIRFE
jgi:hypothetical protein